MVLHDRSRSDMTTKFVGGARAFEGDAVVRTRKVIMKGRWEVKETWSVVAPDEIHV